MTGREKLRKKFCDMLNQWAENGLPSRLELEKTAEELKEWKSAENVASLWEKPPVMVTATIDDALGYGLAIIHMYAKAAGVELIPLGLLQDPEKIVKKCAIHKADILGMTILQFDSEDDVTYISGNLHQKTKIVAGGPLFKSDPDLASRSGIHVVAKDVSEFVKYLIELP